MPYTQENRLIAIDTPLGTDVLLLTGFSGAEGLFSLFSVGGSSFKVTPGGIEISGPKIISEAQGNYEIKGAMVKLN